MTFRDTIVVSDIKAEQVRKSAIHWCIENKQIFTIFESGASAEYTNQIFLWRINIGASSNIEIFRTKNALARIQNFIDREEGLKVCFLSYELKNAIEKLESRKRDRLKFPLATIVVPQIIITCHKDLTIEWQIQNKKSDANIQEILNYVKPLESKLNILRALPNATVSKKKYANTVQKIMDHIHKGDVFELNYCIEQEGKWIDQDEFQLYDQLRLKSSAQFCTMANLGNHIILSISPERFLQKRGREIISQPIKGTISGEGEPDTRERAKRKLQKSVKDIAENTMIVDLVRNDFSKICKPGSVVVPEYCEVKDYKNVFQMVSTIKGELLDTVDFKDILKATFPMGSMTGAPKVKALQLIEKYESSRRGLYSGAIGYLDELGDFDLNVVIRTIIVNKNEKIYSFHTGGAITSRSNAKEEYDEVMVKANSLIEVLTGIK